MEALVRLIQQWLVDQKARHGIVSWRATGSQHLCLEVRDKIEVHPLALQASAMEQITLNGIEYFPAVTLPDWFYHGTDVPSGMNILVHGLLPSSAVGQRPHHPDGVYSYSSLDISEQSMYNNGCLCTFKSYGVCLPLSANTRFSTVPLGCVMRWKRSASKRFGAAGQEWVHHPQSIQLHRIQFQVDLLQSFFKQALMVQTCACFSSCS